LCRVLFLFLNIQYFYSLSWDEALTIFIYGVRFDLSAITYLNALFIILHIIPGYYKNRKGFQAFLKIFFILVNGLSILANIADSKFFEFEEKRTTSDIFTPQWLGNDFLNLLPTFLLDYWYLLIIWILMTYLFWKFYPKGIFRETKSWSIKIAVLESIGFILFTGLFTIASRGGLQLKPVRIISAAKYTSAHNIPLVLNTPFTIIKSLGKNELPEVNYFNKDSLEKLYNPVLEFKTNLPFKNYNVVVLILESFGKEYFGSLNTHQGYTPFLDSLMQHSLVFTNAYSNGKKSMDAMPSIFAGIPSLMDASFITSNFSSNSINSLPSVLAERNYYSAFFHGGKNGTMGFDEFARLAGFRDYFGKDQYPNQNDYDGNWGIYDEPYLQYFAHKLSTFQQPFFTSLFTLSSHHPYTIPAKYAGKFPKGILVNSESIGYTDFAIQKFFQTARKQNWYKNTLFVITADHTAQAYHPFYKTRLGMFAIPIIFYQPADSTLIGFDSTVCQQIDIMPSVLEYLNYNGKIYSFGISVFSQKADHFAINYINSVYQLISGDYNFLFDGQKGIGFYKYTTDSELKVNLIQSKAPSILFNENKIKAIIQTYRDALVTNHMSIKN
jgi:phosphoglycerol transferase MdoB-like AlkP superfamily enzyme